MEAPFTVQVRGEDLPEHVRKLAGDGGPLPTVVRGVIDLVFREPAGSWTVVDWKTDSVTEASENCWKTTAAPRPNSAPTTGACRPGRRPKGGRRRWEIVHHDFTDPIGNGAVEKQA